MSKIKASMLDLKTTIPGAIILIASVVGFFMKITDMTGLVLGFTTGATLMGINTKPKA